jgi:hypothetical protein
VFAGVDVTPCPCSINTLCLRAAHHLVIAIAPAALASLALTPYGPTEIARRSAREPIGRQLLAWYRGGNAAAVRLPRAVRRPAGGPFHFRPCVQMMPARVGLLSLGLQKNDKFGAVFMLEMMEFKLENSHRCDFEEIKSFGRMI